jgi:hypothetical protein
LGGPPAQLHGGGAPASAGAPEDDPEDEPDDDPDDPEEDPDDPEDEPDDEASPAFPPSRPDEADPDEADPDEDDDPDELPDDPALGTCSIPEQACDATTNTKDTKVSPARMKPSQNEGYPLSRRPGMARRASTWA